MEILDEQAPIKRPYNSRALKLGIGIYCMLLTLASLFMWGGASAEAIGYGIGRSIIFWVIGLAFYFWWKANERSVSAGIVIFIVLLSFLFFGQLMES